MTINCIVIEDEPLALRKITEYIGMIDYLNLVKTFDSAVSAVSYLNSNSVDLIFLDIRMKRLTGIQLLESIEVKPAVIITTAYDEYALKGYELDVIDYVLKPFSVERFIKAVDKAYRYIKKPTEYVQNDFIFVKTEYRTERIDINNILYIQGMKDYLMICTTSKKIMTLMSFKNIIKLLPGNIFTRVHNSYIVSIPKIDSIERNRINIGDAVIPISNSYRDDFINKIKH